MRPKCLTDSYLLESFFDIRFHEVFLQKNKHSGPCEVRTVLQRAWLGRIHACLLRSRSFTLNMLYAMRGTCL